MKKIGNFFSRPGFAPSGTRPFSFRWGRVLGLLALMASLTLALPAGAAEEKRQGPLVELEAEGTVQVKPDKATFTFAVVTEAAQAQEASQANAKEAEKFLEAVKKTLGPEDKVKTLHFQVMPIFRKTEKVQGKEKVRKDEIAGYRAVHRFLVEVRDLTRLGQVADTALKNGANEGMGPFFGHTQEESLNNQAVVKALERARTLAEALAQASGLKLKRVVKMSTSHEVRPRFAAAKAMPPGAGPEGEPPLEVGEITFHGRLTVTFELTP